MRGKMVMKWVDRGWAKLYKDVVSNSQMHVDVGVIGTKADETHPLRGNITVGDVALINEFGSGAAGVPERSFIRRSLLWSTVARREYQRLAALVSHEVMFRKVPRSVAMRKIGEWAVARIKTTILSNVPPPNADATIAQKGHDHTLIHTDTLFDSIDYAIVGGRGSGSGGSGGE